MQVSYGSPGSPARALTQTTWPITGFCPKLARHLPSYTRSPASPRSPTPPPPRRRGPKLPVGSNPRSDRATPRSRTSPVTHQPLAQPVSTPICTTRTSSSTVMMGRRRSALSTLTAWRAVRQRSISEISSRTSIFWPSSTTAALLRVRPARCSEATRVRPVWGRSTERS